MADTGAMDHDGASHSSKAHGGLMDAIYRRQRHIYDATRKYYLLGRDRLIADLRHQLAEQQAELDKLKQAEADEQAAKDAALRAEQQRLEALKRQQSEERQRLQQLAEQRKAQELEQQRASYVELEKKYAAIEHEYLAAYEENKRLKG